MRDQIESIKKELIETIRAEVLILEKSGLTRTKISEKAGVQLPFMSNFMGSNWEGINGLAIPKLIKMANGLELRIDLIVKKKTAL